MEPRFRTPRVALSEIALRGIESVDVETIKDIALEVWHGTRALSLGELVGPRRIDAMRLVGRLADFEITPDVRKRILHNQIRAASGFTVGTDEAVPAPEFDEQFSRMIPQLEPLQHKTYSLLRRN